MKVKIVAVADNAPGKLAEAEIHFEALGPDAVAGTAGSLLSGLKLIGFAIWERRGGNGRNVTFPARSYTINGERRSFALLRPIKDVYAQERIRQAILDAYAEYEAAQAESTVANG